MELIEFLHIFQNFIFSLFIRAFKPPKGTSWIFNTFYDKFSCIYVQPFRSSGPETKKINFFIFFIIMGKVYMHRQYDPQKAQLEHKAQVCAKFHKRKSNSFCTVVRKRKRDARPPDGHNFVPLTAIPEDNFCLG